MHNVALQRGVGVETGLVAPDELGEIDPALRTEGVALAAYEPRGGYADPAATAVGFLRAARELGARFERRRVTALLEHRGRIRGVQTDGGPMRAETVVLAAGAWSVPLAGSVGLVLPVRPARVRVALLERPYELPTHLALIDTTAGFYARPAAERATLVGSRDSLEWLPSSDEPTPEPDSAFVRGSLAPARPAHTGAGRRSLPLGPLRNPGHDARRAPAPRPRGPRRSLPGGGVERDRLQKGAHRRGGSGTLGLGGRPEETGLGELRPHPLREGSPDPGRARIRRLRPPIRAAYYR